MNDPTQVDPRADGELAEEKTPRPVSTNLPPGTPAPDPVDDPPPAPPRDDDKDEGTP
jgi:hypothetical protein